MRSIPWALTWETLYHGRWMLPAAFAVANFMPLAVESALRKEGLVDINDPSQIIMHVVMTQMNLFIFGFGVMWTQGRVSRLYTAPASNATLAAWHLIPAMALVWTESVLSGLMMNALFDLDWPIWGPALFSAVAIAAVYASLWQTEKSSWVIYSLGGVTLILGMWYKTRHGGLSGQPTGYWREVTILEAATLALFAVLSFYAAIKGIARDRQGEILPSLGFLAWMERILDPAPAMGAPFRSPEDAQFWYVWSQKGWAMPVCVVFGTVIALCGWTIFNRNAQELMNGFQAGGILLSVVGMLGGLIMGNCGQNDASFEMGNFLATRPLNTRALSRVVIKTLIRSSLMSWGIWLGVFGLAYLLVRAFGSDPDLQVLREWGWWYFPMTILGPWVIASLGAALGLSGRTLPIAVNMISFVALPVVGMVAAQIFLSRDMQQLAGRSLVSVASMIAILVTFVAYWLARRRRFIEPSALLTAGLVWLLCCVPVAFQAAHHPDQIFPQYMAVIAILALAVAPFSTIPLALNWNRVR